MAELPKWRIVQRNRQRERTKFVVQRRWWRWWIDIDWHYSFSFALVILDDLTQTANGDKVLHERLD